MMMSEINFVDLQLLTAELCEFDQTLFLGKGGLRDKYNIS